MITRKILSWVLTGALIGAPIIPWITSASSNAWGTEMNSNSYNNRNDSYSSTKKIKSFLSWEKRILAYMTKDYNSVVMRLKNVNAKKAYASEFSDIISDIEKVFSGAEYGSDYMLSTYVASLKKEIGAYKSLRKELLALSGSTSNPFSLGTEETTSIENDIIDLQKTVTVALKQAIDNYDTSDFKETGKMNINAESSFGKVDISIEKYTKLLSLLTKSQEADIVATAKFTINMPGSSRYNTKSQRYDKTPWETISGDLSIDGSVKIIENDVYLSLRDYTLNTNLKGSQKTDLEKSMKEFAQYKGKTVKIPLSSTGASTKSFNQAEILAQLKKTLSILEEKSLLTPYKKIGDIYTLTLKDETIQSIGSIYSQDIKTAEITKAKQEMRKNPIFYSSTDGKKTIFMQVNESDASGLISLTKKDTGYSLLVDVHSLRNSSDSVYILIEKDFIDAKIVTKEININLSYKNKSLLFTEDGYMQNLRIEWPIWAEDANLDFTYNGKKIGNTTWKKVNDTYTYDVLFELTIAQVLSKFHLNGESTLTKGTFPIVAPKDFVEIEKKSPSLNQEALPSDFSDL